MISNVSFMAKKEAPFYPTEKIRNMTAGRLATTTNQAYALASEDVGRTITPLRKITGDDLQKRNPGCFDGSTRLTKKGLEGFEAVNGKILNLSVDSSAYQYREAMRQHLANCAYFEDDGKTATVTTQFDYYSK